MIRIGLLLLASLLLVAADEKPDILFADFEGEDYGAWKVEGNAFGTRPAQGTLPGQMPVTGFKGKGLVNSFVGGDNSTGTLTSPEFRIERKYISFLIGGGGFADKTCMNLLVDGKVLRTATGPNTAPGGSEHLDPAAWDVADLAGKTARIQIVDQATGGWGHINVDHIVFSDTKPEGLLVEAKREITLDKRFLLIPVKTGAPKRRMTLTVEGKLLHDFEIELADGKADLQAHVDLEVVQGKKVVVQAGRMREDSKALDAITTSHTSAGEGLYREKRRPQFHFTARRGWLNDPNGLVYAQGEWHLFFQHNPYGWNWGNMHWGHAVSKDLIHWRELPIALYPRRFGDWAFSGSAVVDRDNTSGFQVRAEPPLVLAYTSTGRGECIAYSNDRGRTWQEYDANPVVRHSGRDPRLLWHAASKQWVMAVYDEHEGKRWVAFHTSPDLKKWTFQSRIADFFECPDLFELPVQGSKDSKRWVLYAADGRYLVGDFDGKTFKPEGGKQQLWHGKFYAAQTWSDAPDGRRIQIGWGQGIDFPGMPFNQQMTVPCELSLHSTPEGVRMRALPVKELESLYGKKHTWKDLTVKPGENPLADVKAETFELRVTFEPAADEWLVIMNLLGIPVNYTLKTGKLTCKGLSMPLWQRDGKITLRILMDRGSLEIFGNDGAAALSVGAVPAEEDRSLVFKSRWRDMKIHALEVIELKSAWE
jgi:fructan beta-fructosidase